MRDKIELDKTISKYRSDIHDILNTAKKPKNTVDTDSTRTMYCPKAASPGNSSNPTKRVSFFDSLKSSFSLGGHTNAVPTAADAINSPTIGDRDQQSYNLRSRHSRHRDSSIPPAESIGHKPTLPVKEAFSLGHFFRHTIMPFMSQTGMQLSRLLPYLVIILFTIIILTYYRLIIANSNENAELNANPTDLGAQPKSPLSSSSSSARSEHFYCDDIKDTQCSQTKALIRELIDYLRYKSGQIECSSLATLSSAQPSLNIDFIEKCVHLNKIKDYFVKERSLITDRQHEGVAMESVVKAINKYPHWGLRLLNASYGDTSEPSQVTYIMSAVSSKSVGCRFRELIHFLYVRIIMLASVSLTVVLAYLVVKSLKKKQMEKDTAFFNLVGSVTAMVEKQYEMSLRDPTNTKPFIAISHIYDSLVDPSQRASQKKLWNKVNACF